MPGGKKWAAIAGIGSALAIFSMRITSPLPPKEEAMWQKKSPEEKHKSKAGLTLFVAAAIISAYLVKINPFFHHFFEGGAAPRDTQ